MNGRFELAIVVLTIAAVVFMLAIIKIEESEMAKYRVILKTESGTEEIVLKSTGKLKAVMTAVERCGPVYEIYGVDRIG